MNRSLLKFRAWDPISKRMYPEFYLFGETTCFDLISQWLMEATPEASSLMRMNDAVITQFTGLQDSKGKDIFDGDVIEGEFYDEDDRASRVTKYEVVFNNGAFNIASRNWYKPSLKVIGNIFENPELLQA